MESTKSTVFNRLKAGLRAIGRGVRAHCSRAEQEDVHLCDGYLAAFMRRMSSLVCLWLGAGLVMAPSWAADQSSSSRTRHESKLALPISGIDHLPDHVSVQNFWVNGISGQQAGKGGSRVCCVNIPRVWSPGMKVSVRWGVLNWRDDETDLYEVKDASVAPFEPSEVSALYVHFLPDGSVRVVPSREGPTSPMYLGPRVRIPAKELWDVYGVGNGPTKICRDHTVVPMRACVRD